ncbi:MAG: ribonuclease PH [Planctomycetota bacterium]
MRTDGRMTDELRPMTLERDYTRYAEGSVLVTAGQTRVLCTAMVEDGVPHHCRSEHIGWVTAEYAMLPSSNPDRRSLHRSPSGRTREIQRLIGRSLRLAVDLSQFQGRTIWCDCDVLQADGGTRTASITGAYVALVDALWQMREEETIELLPIKHGISAISVGIVEGRPMLDLTGDEDRAASVDMNVVMTHAGDFVEVQGTAESAPFGQEQMDELLELARTGNDQIRKEQMSLLQKKLTV